MWDEFPPVLSMSPTKTFCAKKNFIDEAKAYPVGIPGKDNVLCYALLLRTSSCNLFFSLNVIIVQKKNFFSATSEEGIKSNTF